MSKSFLIDTIMHEEDKYIFRQKEQQHSPAIITSSREPSPVSDKSPTPSQLSPAGSVSRYTHSPGTSPRSPPTPLSMERLHDYDVATMTRQRIPITSLYSVRVSSSSSCGCCPPNHLTQMCKTCEPGPREGEAAPNSQKLYEYSSRDSSKSYYGTDRGGRIFSMTSPISSSRPRPQFSPMYGKEFSINLVFLINFIV